MNDTEFKLKVSEDIAVIKNDISYIKKAIPSENLTSKVTLNRKLILVIFGSFIPLIVAIIFNIRGVL